MDTDGGCARKQKPRPTLAETIEEKHPHRNAVRANRAARIQEKNTTAKTTSLPSTTKIGKRFNPFFFD
jgi:hypothetical protein